MDHLWLPPYTPAGSQPLKGVSSVARQHIARRQAKKGSRQCRSVQVSTSVQSIVAGGWSRFTHSDEAVAEVGQEDPKTSVVAESLKDGALTPSADLLFPVVTSASQKPLSRRTRPSKVLPPAATLGGSWDPFSSTSIAMNADIHAVLQYYMDFALIGPYRLEALATTQPVQEHRHFGQIRNAIRDGLWNTTHLYCILAEAAAKMSLITSSGFHNSRLADYFMHCALRGLRQSSISDATDPESKAIFLRSILHLCTAEWYRHNFSAISTHMSMLKQLTSTWFCFQELEPDMHFTMEMIGIYDTFTSIELGEKPIFLTTWRPPRLSREKQVEVETRVLCRFSHNSGDRKSWDRVIIHPEMTDEDLAQGRSSSFLRRRTPSNDFEILAEDHALAYLRQGGGTDLRGLRAASACGAFSRQLSHFLAEVFWPWHICTIYIMTHDAETEEVEWASRTGIAILHQLHHDSCATSNSFTPRETATRIALVMCLSHIYSPLAWRSTRSLSRRLQASLKAIEIGLTFEEAYCPSPIEGELTMWVLTLGVITASEVGSRESEWFASRAMSLALHLRLVSFQDMFDLTASFVMGRLIMQQPCIINLVKRISTAAGTPRDCL